MNEVTLTVGILAAVASMVGAVVAWMNAGKADKSARVIAGTGHELAEIDRRIAAFETAWIRFMTDIGTLATTKNPGAILASAVLLSSNPDCPPQLAQEISGMAADFSQALTGRGARKEGIDAQIVACTAGARAAIEALRAERREALSSRSLAEPPNSKEVAKS